MYVCVYVTMSVCVCAGVSVCMLLCMCACACVCLHVSACMCVSVGEVMLIELSGRSSRKGAGNSGRVQDGCSYLDGQEGLTDKGKELRERGPSKERQLRRLKSQSSGAPAEQQGGPRAQWGGNKEQQGPSTAQQQEPQPAGPQATVRTLASF